MTRVVMAVAAVLAMSCSGCADTLDPYDGPGMWRPEGANAGNMAAMVQRPADFVHGRDDRAPLRVEAQDAVLRLWQDHPRPLSGSSAANSGATGSPGSAGSTPKDNN